MEAPKPLKKAEEPLVVFVRFYGEQKARIAAVLRKHGVEPNDLARMGVVSELHRLETLGEISEEYAALIQEAHALGLDPAPHLRALIADATGGAN